MDNELTRFIFSMILAGEATIMRILCRLGLSEEDVQLVIDAAQQMEDISKLLADIEDEDDDTDA